MSDWNDLVRFNKARGRLPLVLLHNNGRYVKRESWSWAGSIPIELCHLSPSGQYTSNVYYTKEEAMAAAKAVSADFQE